MKIGFLGFGEAASSIAKGLFEEGLSGAYCYDVMQNNERFAEAIADRVTACEGIRCESAADVCRNADVVISAVQSNYAVSAAQSAMDGIHEGLIFMDVSTATPKEKKEIAEAVEAKGASFVDGAMMGALLKSRHKVPMLLSGSGAAKIKELLDPYHMRLDVVGDVPGTATSIKFIRSITAKGLSCLLFESLQTAQKFGVEDTIVASFLDTFGDGFIEIINGYVSGAIIHAARREHEMLNVVDFLKSEDLPYTMAEATRQKLAWMRDEDFKSNFENGVPRDWKKVLAGWKVNG